MIGVISCHAIFNESAFVMCQRFKFELVKDFNPKENDVYIVFGAHEKAVELYMAQKQANNKFGYIIYNSEQASSDYWKNKYYTMLCRDNVVFNYSNDLAKELEKKFRLTTYSFFTWDYLTWADVEPHDHYDIVFLGVKSDEREELHQELLKAFPDKKIMFHYEGQYLSPDKLTSLLRNTDVLIDYSYYKDNILATHRINKGISCGCKIVSVFSSDNDMNEFYDDYIYFSNNIPKFLKKAYETGFAPKKNWEEFTQTVGKKFLPHNIQIIKHVEQKLLDRNEKLNKETTP